MADTYSTYYKNIDTLTFKIQVCLLRMRTLEQHNTAIPKEVYDEFKQTFSQLQDILTRVSKYVEEAYRLQHPS